MKAPAPDENPSDENPSNELATARLRLRPMRGSDIARTVEVLGDLEVSRRLSRVPHPYTERDARAFLEILARGRADGSIDHFAISLLRDPLETQIGAIGVHDEGDGGTAEVGYWIAPEHWNRGIAREALAAVVRHAFRERSPPRTVLRSAVFATNPASARVLEACGFAQVGETVQRSLATGRDEPSLLFELRRA